MDEFNACQQQDATQIKNDSFTTTPMHYGEWKPTSSSIHPNPTYMMQENEDKQPHQAIDNQNKMNQNDELSQLQMHYEEQVQLPTTVNTTNGNEYSHYDMPGQKLPKDITDRVHLPSPLQPPGNRASSLGHYVSPPQVPPDDHIMPSTMPLTVNSLSPDKGIHEIVLEKDDRGKLGLKVKNIKMGVYVMEVAPNSPAFQAGILPGDRILQINNIKVDKFDDEKMSEFLKKLPPTSNRMVINKRPLEKIITVQKDEKGQMGLHLRSTKIHTVAKNSPADIVGLSTDYYLLEVNGTKLRGKTEDEIRDLLKSGDVITVTVMPYYLYEPLMKQIPIR